MAEEVKYVLTLDDMLHNKLVADDAAATGLEGKLSLVKTAALGIGAAIGAFATFEFLKGSVEMFNEAAQASAQLDASLVSTGNAANLNRDALDKQAEALMKTSLFDDDAITSTQALLATFTSIHDTIFTQAIPAITDLATKMGGDLQGATIQVGKALNDPIQGINALSRVGVSFTDAQKDVIKHLVETNHVAEAQTMILAELNKEFGGSAAAAAAAGTGPFTVLANEFNNIREEIGGMVVSLGTMLLPVLETVVQAFSGFVSWIKESKDGIIAVAEGIGIGVAAYIIYESVVGITTLATTLWTGAQWLLNAALTANPIGIVIVAIGALAAGFIYVYNKSETFRAGLNGIWETIKEWASLVKEAFEGVWHVIHGVFTLDADEIKLGTAEQLDVMENAGKRLAGAFRKGYDSSMKESADKANAAKYEDDALNAFKAAHNGLTPDQVKNAGGTYKPAGGATSGTSGKTKSAGSVAGPKVINISVTIGNLVNDLKIQYSNLAEGVDKTKEMITRSLVGAVNDFQNNLGQ